MKDLKKCWEIHESLKRPPLGFLKAERRERGERGRASESESRMCAFYFHRPAKIRWYQRNRENREGTTHIMDHSQTAEDEWPTHFMVQ